MLINQPVSRSKWRRLVASLKHFSSAHYVPEYQDGHDSYSNRQYYR